VILFHFSDEHISHYPNYHTEYCHIIPIVTRQLITLLLLSNDIRLYSSNIPTNACHNFTITNDHITHYSNYQTFKFQNFAIVTRTHVAIFPFFQKQHSIFFQFSEDQMQHYSIFHRPHVILFQLSKENISYYSKFQKPKVILFHLPHV